MKFISTPSESGPLDTPKFHCTICGEDTHVASYCGGARPLYVAARGFGQYGPIDYRGGQYGASIYDPTGYGYGYNGNFVQGYDGQSYVAPNMQLPFMVIQTKPLHLNPI